MYGQDISALRPSLTMTGDSPSLGMFQNMMLMTMVQSSRHMQQEIRCTRVKGLWRGGFTADIQMCSSRNPVDVRAWNKVLGWDKGDKLDTGDTGNKSVSFIL